MLFLLPPRENPMISSSLLSSSVVHNQNNDDNRRNCHQTHNRHNQVWKNCCGISSLNCLRGPILVGHSSLHAAAVAVGACAAVVGTVRVSCGTALAGSGRTAVAAVTAAVRSRRGRFAGWLRRRSVSAVSVLRNLVSHQRFASRDSERTEGIYGEDHRRTVDGRDDGLGASVSKQMFDGIFISLFYRDRNSHIFSCRIS